MAPATRDFLAAVAPPKPAHPVFAACVLTLAFCAITPSHAGQGRIHTHDIQALRASLDSYAQETLDRWQVPGLAFGIVADDALVYAKGLGVNLVDSDQTTSPKTIFQIASLAKAFLGSAQAMLVDEGKLAWDDRVLDHDPAFRMYDPWVSAEFRIQDLLAQRSGMPAYALGMLIDLGYSRADMLRAMRYVAPTSSFRMAFAYQNTPHLQAERIIAQVTGAPSWEAFLQERILTPLRMDSTTYTLAGLTTATDHTSGHRRTPQGMVPIEVKEHFYNVGGAGNLNSNIEDLSRWLRLHINQGELDGTRLINSETLKETWSARIPVSAGSFYGTGWVTQYRPTGSLVWHSGGTHGTSTFLGFDPERRFGIVVLTNLGTGEPGTALGMGLFKIIMGEPAGDHGERMLAASFQEERERMAMLARPAAPLPAGSLDRYEGRYVHPALGTLDVKENEGTLNFAIGPRQIVSRLEPWSGEIFAWHLPPSEAASLGDPVGLVKFEIDPASSARTARLIWNTPFIHDPFQPVFRAHP